MVASTEILPFGTAGGANVMSQADYNALAARLAGFASGLAVSEQFNKVLRQASFMSAGLAGFCVDQGVSVPDDGNLPALVAEIEAALAVFVDARAFKLLTTNKTFYINASTGNDSTGDGLGSGTAWATLQHAWDTVQSLYDLAGFTITFQMADGTYSTSFIPTGVFRGQRGPSNVLIQGNTGTPGNVVVTSSTINAINFAYAQARVQYFKLTTTGSGGNSLNMGSSQIEIGAGMQFGACIGAQIDVGSRSVCNVVAAYTINGSAAYHVVAPDGSLVNLGGFSHTVSGTPAFSQQFANAGLGGIINANGTSYSGSATGTRYQAQAGGIIYVAGAGTSVFPGNAAGSGTNFGVSPYGYYA